MPQVRERSATAWLVMLLVAVVNYGNFYVYDSIGPVADLLQRQRGFSDTQIGLLNAIYSLPNVVLILVGGVLLTTAALRRRSWRPALAAPLPVSDEPVEPGPPVMLLDDLADSRKD